MRVSYVLALAWVLGGAVLYAWQLLKLAGLA